MQRESIVFYRSFFEAINSLPMEEQPLAYRAVMEYAFNDNVVEMSGLAAVILSLVKPQLDALPISRFSEISRFHWNWKGGISSKNHSIRNSAEYKKWRSGVFKRDHFTCCDCGKKGGELNAHHVKPFSEYPELRLDISNGITLCKKCHNRRHERAPNG